jgi:hypothetical protein
MASRDSGGIDPGTLAARAPVTLPVRNQLSWALGTSVTDGGRTLSRWAHRGRAWALSVHVATDHTALVRYCSPVGREAFYGIERDAVDAVEADLAAAADWVRAD